MQPCNPAVGGPAKSQLVHEVDALGGEIGKIADRYKFKCVLIWRMNSLFCFPMCCSVGLRVQTSITSESTKIY